MPHLAGGEPVTVEMTKAERAELSTSDAAREFLAAMPTPTALMPTFNVTELQAIRGGEG